MPYFALRLVCGNKDDLVEPRLSAAQAEDVVDGVILKQIRNSRHCRLSEGWVYFSSMNGDELRREMNVWKVSHSVQDRFFMRSVSAVDLA